MKIFHVSFLIVILFSQFSVNAQFSPSRLNFSVSAGYGSYNMHYLKEINDRNKSQLPFSVNTVDDFSSGFYFSGSIQTIFFSKVLAGIIYQYFTTGSRIGRKDYSGYYAFDQIAKGHYIGLEPGINVLNMKVIFIDAFVQVGTIFSDITMNENLIVGEFKEKYSQNLTAFSIAITPTIKASIPIIHPLRCSLSLGRMIDTGGKVHLPKNKDAVVMVNGSEVKTGWSGWRTAIELNINFMNN